VAQNATLTAATNATPAPESSASRMLSPPRIEARATPPPAAAGTMARRSLRRRR